MTKIAHPSMLSFIRSINPSAFGFFGVNSTDAGLFSLADDALEPVRIVRETLRGTQAAAATKEKDRGVPNIQRIDFARLPHGKDALLVDGNVLVTADSITAHTCNDLQFQSVHGEFTAAFVKAGGMKKLAERYVLNLLNGAILFRNQLGGNIRCAVQADNLTVEVSRDTDLAAGVALTLDDVIVKATRNDVEKLVSLVEAALSGARAVLHLAVRAYAEFGYGQEVYPSQEFAEDQAKGEGRVLARTARNDIDQAAFHGRKVGNAIRTIDNWYPNAVKPLPVEPYAPDQTTQTAMRGTKVDFYSLMLQMPAMTEALNKGEVSNDALYIAAVFIRGGVFSKKAS